MFRMKHQHQFRTQVHHILSLRTVRSAGATPNNAGGVPTSWTITAGVIPSGLSVDPSTGEITGTPTTVTPSTVTIDDRSQLTQQVTTSTTVDINVQDEAPASISYPGSPYTFTKNDPASGATPTYTAGTPTSWAITAGSMPAGLSVDSSTGEITGTPTTVTPSTVTLTIEATNSAGTTSTTVDINVQDEAPASISYPGSPYTFTKNSPASGATPTYTAGTPTSWAITAGSMPAGLSVDSSTGEITGTPTTVTPSTVTLTIEATNSAGTTSTTVDINVQDEAPASISYPGSPYTFTKNSPASGATPTYTAGTPTSWAITAGSMPAGLSVDSSTGEITGTPTTVTPSTVTLTIEATNSAGTTSTTVDINVQDEAPASISYPGSPYTFTKNSPASGATPTYTAGTPTSWAITAGSMPAGLSVDSSTGEITGTPTTVTPSTVTIDDRGD